MLIISFKYAKLENGVMLHYSVLVLDPVHVLLILLLKPRRDISVEYSSRSSLWYILYTLQAAGVSLFGESNTTVYQ